MRTLASLDSPINSLVVSPDGSTVITASNEGIGFLDLTSGQRSVTPLEDEVSRLTWGPDGLLAGTLAGEVWSVRGAPARLFEAIDEEISGIAATGDGTIAVCGGEPFAVATFGPHGNEEWRGEPYKWPYCVRFSPDGKLLAVATWDGYLFVFDVHDLPDELTNLDGEHAGGPIFDARFLPGDRVLVVGASFVRIWDRGTSKYTANRELDAEAFAADVSPDGTCAVVSTNDQRLRLFSLPELTELGELASGNRGTQVLSYFPDYAEFCHVKGPATIRTLAFHPDGMRVFGSTEDHRIVEVSRAELQRAARPATTSTAAAPAIAAPAAVAPANVDLASASVGMASSEAASGASVQSTSAQSASRKPTTQKSAAKKAAKTPAARPTARAAGAKSAARSTAAKPAARSTAAKPADRSTAAKATGRSIATKPAARSVPRAAIGAKSAARSIAARSAVRAAIGAGPAARAAIGAKTAARTIGAKAAARGIGAKPAPPDAIGAKSAARTIGARPAVRAAIGAKPAATATATKAGSKIAATRIATGKRAATKPSTARKRSR